MFEIDSDTLKDIINIISNLDFEEKNHLMQWWAVWIDNLKNTA